LLISARSVKNAGRPNDTRGMFQNELFAPTPLALADDADGGIRYLPDVIPKETANDWFEQLMRDVQWSNQRRMMYEREVDVPRLMASFSLAGEAVPSPLIQAAWRVRVVARAAFNSIGLNLYRDGSDSVAPHSDKTHYLVPHMPIAIVSLGATRRMAIRSKSDRGCALQVDLHPGSVLLMSYASQFTHTHSIPKAAGINEPRISLALRCVVETQKTKNRGNQED